MHAVCSSSEHLFRSVLTDGSCKWHMTQCTIISWITARSYLQLVNFAARNLTDIRWYLWSNHTDSLFETKATSTHHIFQFSLNDGRVTLLFRFFFRFWFLLCRLCRFLCRLCFLCLFFFTHTVLQSFLNLEQACVVTLFFTMLYVTLCSTMLYLRIHAAVDMLYGHAPLLDPIRYISHKTSRHIYPYTNVISI